LKYISDWKLFVPENMEGMISKGTGNGEVY